MRFDLFIRRPVLSSVCALVIVLLGAISIPRLPVAQYPNLALPQVQVTAVYTGASAQVVEQAVTNPLEREINGVPGMKSITSASTNDGVSFITVTFEPTRNIDLAAVDVQNRVQTATGFLPQEVRQNGLTITKSQGNFVMGLALYDVTGRLSQDFVSNYADIYLRDALKRVKGVGNVEVFAARRYAMRVWLDSARLAARQLTALDVVQALREQNLQVAAGQLGRPPAPAGLPYQLNVVARGRLSSPEEFEAVVLKTGPGGAQVRLGDVARVEVGAEDSAQLLLYNGRLTSGLGISQLPGANALEVAAAVKAEVKRLSRSFPAGLTYEVAFDSTPAVEASIREVLKTLLEAMVLVVLVILLFLQGVRATLIPAIVIPVSLVGTFAFVKLMGFSINTLTLFGLTLATGLVVDDAIVVIENISRHLERSPDRKPLDAAVEGLGEVVGPVIAISLVLIAVFVPVSFFPGSTGIIYQQFALTIAFSVAISTFVSLSLTPALSALLLKHQGEHKPAVFQAVDRALDALHRSHAYLLKRLLARPGAAMLAFGLLLAATAVAWKVVPTGFVPDEDQGWFIVAVNGPDGSSLERTGKVLERVDQVLRAEPAVQSVFAVGGFSFGGAGANRGVLFINMKDWSQRHGAEQSVAAVVDRLRGPLSAIAEAVVIPFPPPPVEGIDALGGFQLELEDRSLQATLPELAQATRAVMEKANQTPGLTGVFSQFTADDPQLLVEVDREKAKALGIGLDQLFGTLQVSMGSAYVNDFDYANRAYRVYVQAQPSDRDAPGDLGALSVRSSVSGALVPLDGLVRTRNGTSAQTISHYNLFRSVEVTGSAAPGTSSGRALELMEGVARSVLPQGFELEWAGLSREELESGGQTGLIFLLGLVFVFLVLAGQYESFALPVVVIFSVPLAVLGALTAQSLRGLPDDVFCQVGMVMLVGLSCKNAILIVEFAARLRREGKDPVTAVSEASELRLRPILMTSLAFLFGVVPLMLASGAGAAARASLGTAVFGGMLLSTALGLYFTPLLFVVVERLRGARA